MGVRDVRIELNLDEIQNAIEDYLIKQGLEKGDIKGILFQKPDGSLNYDVKKIEVSVETR